MTNADSRLWRTFATLVRRPGEFTRAYMRGVRVPYLKPLQLFLIVNVVYFVWTSYSGERVFDTPLGNHFANTSYGGAAVRLVRTRLAERHLSLETYRASFGAAATAQAKSLIVTWCRCSRSSSVSCRFAVAGRWCSTWCLRFTATPSFCCSQSRNGI